MPSTGQLSIESLQQELSLKKLQINSLLTITQAINDNVAAPELYSMYKSFIGWEMGVKRMALFFLQDGQWKCAVHLNSPEVAKVDDLGPMLQRYSKLHRINVDDPSILQGFDLVIPVYHKKYPIAFALIGGMKADDDEYNRIQFITTFTNIIAVAIENKRLFKRQIEQERFARDMELASQVQKMLIPEQMPQSPFFDLSPIYKPHTTVGGDYFDFIQYDQKRLTLCIADISGKGVSAAILMANFQAILRSLIHQYRDLETFVFALNEAVFRITRSDRFITLFIAELNLHDGKLQYINAGHYPPFLIQGDKITRLDSGCTVIGAFETLPFIQMGTLDLDGPGTLFACTDGLTDVTNPLGQYFDEERISAILRNADNYATAADLNAVLMYEVDQFRDSLPYPDDIALLTCKFKA